MFFPPWYPALMLAVETSNVIDIRLRKVAQSSAPADAHTEINPMVTEKIAAAMEASVIMMSGETTAAVFSRYREEVVSWPV